MASRRPRPAPPRCATLAGDRASHAGDRGLARSARPCRCPTWAAAPAEEQAGRGRHVAQPGHRRRRGPDGVGAVGDRRRATSRPCPRAACPLPSTASATGGCTVASTGSGVTGSADTGHHRPVEGRQTVAERSEPGRHRPALAHPGRQLDRRRAGSPPPVVGDARSGRRRRPPTRRGRPAAGRRRPRPGGWRRCCAGTAAAGAAPAGRGGCSSMAGPPAGLGRPRRDRDLVERLDDLALRDLRRRRPTAAAPTRRAGRRRRAGWPRS